MFGLFVGTALLAWYPDPYRFGAKNTVQDKVQNLRYIVRNLRGPTMWGAVACGTFSLAECVMESMRDEANESTWVNSAFGGAAAGVVLGTMSRRVDIMAAAGLGGALMMGIFEFNAQHSAGTKTRIEQLQDLADGKNAKKDGPGSVAGLKAQYPEYRNL